MTEEAGQLESDKPTEEPKSSVVIPGILLDGLAKIEEGNQPMMIPRRLEIFLTEHGVFRLDMSPEEAWQSLRRLRDGEPEPKQEPKIHNMPLYRRRAKKKK
jgi:hypothetical protein